MTNPVSKTPVYSGLDLQNMIIELYPSTLLPCRRILYNCIYEILFPDGKSGYIRNSARHFPDTILDIHGDAEYLWGGIVPQGCDCSGFMTHLFRSHGIVIPRDSWQQLARTEGACYNEDGNPPNDESLITDIKDIAPGDLAFFNEFGQGRAYHVGLVSRERELIHYSRGLIRKTGRVYGKTLLSCDLFWKLLRRTVYSCEETSSVIFICRYKYF